MTKLYKGVDGAFAGHPLPPGTEILAAYIGEPQDPGNPDTPHIWTAAEWNAYIEPNPELRLLPIYVHSFPGDPQADAHNAADAAYELGWKPGAGRFIAFDLEMLVDPVYVSEFSSYLAARGFAALPYGTARTVSQNPILQGQWVAELTPKPPTALPPRVIGVQWKFGAEWDYDVFSRLVFDNCGTGLRQG